MLQWVCEIKQVAMATPPRHCRNSNTASFKVLRQGNIPPNSRTSVIHQYVSTIRSNAMPNIFGLALLCKSGKNNLSGFAKTTLRARES
jgi:hypothetical protein